MASIVRQANGHRMIQFVDSNGKRRSMRLGKINRRAAEAIRTRVESLAYAKLAGQAPDDETARWVANLDEVLQEKLARAGLIAGRAQTQLKPFLDAYIKSRCDTKPSTRIIYGHARRYLVRFFGPDRKLRDITPGDADEWRLYLIKAGLSENTVRRRCGLAKQFFHAAARKGLIDHNPFADFKVAVRANVARMYFITREEAQLVLDACPNAQWRLIFALSRYGGLRCPSEHLSLKWSHIHWDRNRMTVPSPKTEHCLGGASRMIPLFPELLPYLQEVFDAAEPGTEYVITRYRTTNTNLRTQLHKIIRRAGLLVWPKLFQNLRSTRETELAEQYPLHVVCAWMGNSQPVAAKHYLQVTEQHYDLATGQVQRAGANQDPPLQNALQQDAAWARTASAADLAEDNNRRRCQELRHHAKPCDPGEK